MAFRKFVLFFAFTFLSAPAFAQGLTPSLSLFYFKEGTRRLLEQTPDPADSVKEQNTYTFVNLGVCYRLDSICLGLKYLQGEIETKMSIPQWSETTKTVITSPGLTVGYSGAEGIVAHATWLLAAKKTISSESTSYTMKEAWVAEFGYGFPVSSVRIGPLVGIYSFKWKERDIAGNKSDLKPSESDEYILPQVALWVDL